MSVQPLQATIVAGTEGPEVEAFKRLRLHETREEWLNRAVALFAPLFEEIGVPLPGKVRVSVGFCSTGRKSRRIGECWASEASADGHSEIFLKPELPDAMMALDVLAHELCHAAVGRKKTTTRLIKCECGDCFNEKGRPYSVRMTREWIDYAWRANLPRVQ